jgi:membrane protein
MQRIKNAILGPWKLFDHHKGFRMAESLSYITLLCFVPVLFVGLSMFASFSAFSDVRQYAQSAILDFLSPQHRDVVEASMNTFLDNAQNLSWEGIVGLIITALVLFFHIESAFETLWGTEVRRNFTSRALLFWALLTLGPLVLGASLLLSATVYEGWARVGMALPLIHTFELFLLHIAGFWVFFRIMPNRSVPALAALMGAIVASVLLKGLKASFAYYVDHVSSYNAIYGTLASIPVFLLLLYAVWVVILLGVCVTVFWGQKHGYPHSS